MKAIAFAIICAAYLLVPASEVAAVSDGWKMVHAVTYLVCIIGFWINILIEGD